MASAPSPTHNHLLAALPASELEHFAGHLELVTLDLLGVRREGVTEAAGRLQRDGLIQYSRGHIEVLDRPGLEQACCECYEVVKLEFDRLLSDIPRGDPLQVLGQAGG